jgi:hypothetical protein
MIPAKTKKSKKRRSRGYGKLVFFIREEDVDEPIEAEDEPDQRTLGSSADETERTSSCVAQLTRAADLSSSSDFIFERLTLDDSDAFSFFLCSTLHHLSGVTVKITINCGLRIYHPPRSWNRHLLLVTRHIPLSSTAATNAPDYLYSDYITFLTLRQLYRNGSRFQDG